MPRAIPAATPSLASGDSRIPVLAGLRLRALRGALRDPAALATRRVLVDRAPLRGAVQHARRFGDGFLDGLAALLDRGSRGLHRAARSGSRDGLDAGASLRLTDALESGTLLLRHRAGTITQRPT